jgi:simple sugar transport system substrate-binding protein
VGTGKRELSIVNQKEAIVGMQRRNLNVLLVVVTGLLVVTAGCVTQPTMPQTPAVNKPVVAEADKKVEKVAVLLPASQTDHGWNQQAADGMAEVTAERGIELEVAENLGYDDITPVLRDLGERGFDLLICHADGYQTVCPEFAQEAGIRVVVVENPGAVTPNLISDLETQAAEVAYLAGVLAGKLTQTGTVGIVVSGEPPTWNFMSVGFAEGLHVTNPDAKLLYGVIGEAAYEDAAGAKRTTESQLGAGADIIFGMGDGASFGMIQAIAEHNAQTDQKAWFIDVIGDKRDIDGNDLLLTSVLFDYTSVYGQIIDDIEASVFGKVYTMDVESGGIRLLELPDAVSPEAVQAVEQAKAAILSGAVTVSVIADAEGVHTRLDELFPK